MSGREGHSVVEEEQRSPAVWLVQRMAPAAELGQAGDPQRSVVVARECPRLIESNRDFR